MSYEQLRSLVGGDNPQAVSYGDIISGIQSQYTPQTQFAPTRSLLDSIGSLVPDQPRIAYGALLQGQPATPIKMFGSTGANNTSISDSLASVDSGVINSDNLLNVGLGGGQDLSRTLVYNNDFANNTDLINNITAGDVTKTGSVITALGALSNNSDLAKAGVALNLIGSVADIKSETDRKSVV
jgi:hypothetical protein